jgi:hypothetical protein
MPKTLAERAQELGAVIREETGAEEQDTLLRSLSDQVAALNKSVATLLEGPLAKAMGTEKNSMDDSPTSGEEEKKDEDDDDKKKKAGEKDPDEAEKSLAANPNVFQQAREAEPNRQELDRVIDASPAMELMAHVTERALGTLQKSQVDFQRQVFQRLTVIEGAVGTICEAQHRIVKSLGTQMTRLPEPGVLYTERGRATIAKAQTTEELAKSTTPNGATKRDILYRLEQATVDEKVGLNPRIMVDFEANNFGVLSQVPEDVRKSFGIPESFPN